MKAIILAGGLGTRISEETSDKPKPMVEISGKPILWHLMSIFAEQGITEFIVATGYKSEVIHEWAKTVIEPWSHADRVHCHQSTGRYWGLRTEAGLHLCG